MKKNDTVRPEFRIYLREKCLINPPPEPVPTAEVQAASLASLFVPKLIEMAIGGVATWLKKAGGKETVNVVGHEFTDFYETDDKQALHVNKAIGCILGVWGVFSAVDGKPSDPHDVAVRKLEDATLVPKNADIKIIYEAAISRVKDGTAFFLDTRHFSVRDFIGSRSKNERAFVITLSVATPDATADGATIGLGQIDMGTVERGADLVPVGTSPDKFPRYRSNLIPWSQISSASKAVYDADVAAGQAKGRHYMPVTFNLTMSETADGNAFLLALGELLDSAKKEAATEISKKILPEDRAKADAERTEAAEKLYQAELDAELAVRQAQKAYDTGPEVDKPVLRVQLESAKRKLDRAVRLRRAAGLPDRDAIPAG